MAAWFYPLNLGLLRQGFWGIPPYPKAVQSLVPGPSTRVGMGKGADVSRNLVLFWASWWSQVLPNALHYSHVYDVFQRLYIAHSSCTLCRLQYDQFHRSRHSITFNTPNSSTWKYHALSHKGQGVGCARAFWGRKYTRMVLGQGRKYTRMVLGQGRKYTRMVLARVARVTASSVHAVRGLICTRGQGPRLYTRNGFAVCTPLFLQLCILCAPCVQVVRFITILFGHV